MARRAKGSGFKMRSGNKPGFKKMGATEAIKQVDTTKAAKGKGSEREIYKAKLRGDYQDLTGDKLKKASYDDPTGTVVSRDPHYLDSPNKNIGDHKHNSKGEHELTETRNKEGSIVKTKGSKSSTYTKTKSTKNRDGSVTEVYTNELGNTETRRVSDV